MSHSADTPSYSQVHNLPWAAAFFFAGAPLFRKAGAVNLPLLCDVPQTLCFLLCWHPSLPLCLLQVLRGMVGFPYFPGTHALTYPITKRLEYATLQCTSTQLSQGMVAKTQKKACSLGRPVFPSI